MNILCQLLHCGGVEDNGVVRILTVAAMTSPLCVAAAAPAPESSSFTEALGPKLEPLDPVMVWVSPFGGLGLLPPRVPPPARLAWLGLADTGPAPPAVARLAGLPPGAVPVRTLHTSSTSAVPGAGPRPRWLALLCEAGDVRAADVDLGRRCGPNPGPNPRAMAARSTWERSETAEPLA